MSEDDLLITNRYGAPPLPLSGGDNVAFRKLMDSKRAAQSTYSSSNPEFTQDKQIDRDLGIGIPEDSVGLEQFIRLGMLDKRKKIRKTVVNIDSRNRTQVAYWDRQSLSVRRFTEFVSPEANRPLQFTFRSDVAYLLLENNYIDNIDLKQFAITNSANIDFTTTGLTKDDFVFNPLSMYPIIDILGYFYDPLVSVYTVGQRQSSLNNLQEPIYDKQRKQYKFNVIKFQVPTKNDPHSINQVSLGGTDLIVEIIRNIRQGFSSSSHYRVTLGRNFSNIYAVRIISSEIPNASYSFTGSSVISNFGQYNLKTVVNNRLRWIYANDYIEQPNYTVYTGNAFLRNGPVATRSPSALQTYVADRVHELFDILNTTGSDYIDAMNRYQSLLYSWKTVPDAWSDNQFTDPRIKDYAFDARFIGEPNLNGVQTPVSYPDKYYLTDTYFAPYQYLLPYLNDVLGLYSYYLLNAPNTESFSLTNTEKEFVITVQPNSGITNFVRSLYDRYKFVNDQGNLIGINPFILRIFPYNQSGQCWSFFITQINYNLIQESYDLVGTPFKGPMDQYLDLYSALILGTSFLFVVQHEFDISLLSTVFARHNTYLYNHINQYFSRTISVLSPVYTIRCFLFMLFVLELQYSELLVYDMWLVSNLYPGITFSMDTTISTIDVQGIWNDPNGNYGSRVVFQNQVIKSDSFAFFDLAFFQSTFVANSFAIDVLNQLLWIAPKDHEWIPETTRHLLLYIAETDTYFMLKRDSLDSLGSNLNQMRYSYEIQSTNFQWLDVSQNYTFQIQNKDEDAVLSMKWFGVAPTVDQDVYLAKYTSVVRFYSWDSITQGYVDYYLGQWETDRWTLKWKGRNEKPEFLVNPMLQTNCFMVMMEESFKTYLRETSDSYLFTQYSNTGSDQWPSAYKMLDGQPVLDASFQQLLPQRTIPISNDMTDVVDIPQYAMIAVHQKNIETGIVVTNYDQEYVTASETDLYIQNPVVAVQSDKLVLPLVLTKTETNSSLSVPNLSKLQRYPIYSMDIDPGKYVETTLNKWVNDHLSNIQRKEYDWSKDIFTTSDVKTRDTQLQHVYNNGTSKFMISLDRNLNSLKFQNFRKIFQTYTNFSLANKQNIYLNEGFPYLYLRVPELSLSNGSMILLEGVSSIDNLSGNELNRTHTVMVPKNYKIFVRQLLPLPQIDYLNSHQNMFSQKGNPDTIDYVVQLYTDYINAAVNKASIRDPKIGYLLDHLFHSGDSPWADLRKMSKRNFAKSNQGAFRKTQLSSHFHKAHNNGERAHMNERGRTVPYERVPGYDGTSVSANTFNRSGSEYAGQTYRNGSNNGNMVNEFNETVPTFVRNGLESAFLENELLMKLEDVYQKDQYSIVGRITRNSTYSDSNGNFEIDYDLFSESGNNFKIGDIVIGLDSQAIGILLPSDYDYSSLLPLDAKLVGIGSYILNHQKEALGSFFSELFALDDLLKPRFEMALQFVQKLHQWQPIANRTTIGFYLSLKTIPNTSRLTGVIGSNMILYVPEPFRFLTGDDTPLSLFGFTSSDYQDTFCYFRDNFQPYETALIRNSFVKRFNDRDVFLLLETKQTGNFQVDDTIYIEDHAVLFNYLSSRMAKYFKLDLMEPFGSWINKVEAMFNTSVQQRVGWNRVSPSKLKWTPYGSVAYNEDMLTLYDNYYQVDPLSFTDRGPIPFQNQDIARCFDQERSQFVWDYALLYQGAPPTESNQFSVSFSSPTEIFSLFVYETSAYDLLSLCQPDQAYLLRFEIPSEYKKVSYYRPIFGSTFTWNSGETSMLADVSFNTRIKIHLTAVRSTYAIRQTEAGIQYEPLGVFERLIENYIQSIYSTFSWDLNRANELNTMYNYQLFENRIIKIKVCPIDENGFSFEPTLDGQPAASSNYLSRTIQGSCRKLFPYYEQKVWRTYFNNPYTGDPVLPLGGSYQGLGRIQQTKSNHDYDMKAFLPGMGVYCIDQESILTNYDSSENKTSRFPASLYTYQTTFIGYVLETSVESMNEYTRDYVLTTDEFAKTDVSNSVYSEYFMYVLLDPSIQTEAEVQLLFDKLNRDYNHLVFDADASVDYSVTPLSIPGATNAKRKYEYIYDLSGSSYVFKLYTSGLDSKDYAFPLQQNQWGVNTNTYTDTLGNLYLQYYEDSNFNTLISPSLIDGFSQTSVSSRLIRRSALNRTLPHYNYQFRKACATVTQRPVFYSGGEVNKPLFVSGDLDYFYKDFLKNKTVVHYKPLWTDKDIQYMNNQQIITRNPPSSNIKVNEKERNIHSHAIDQNYAPFELEQAGVSFFARSGESDTFNTVLPILSFESGDDFVLFDPVRSTLQYSETKQYNQIDRQVNGAPVSVKNVLDVSYKVITGGMIPNTSFPHAKRLENHLDTLVQNTVLVDCDFTNDMERMSRTNIMGKTAGYDLNVVGNNSDFYLYFDTQDDMLSFHHTVEMVDFTPVYDTQTKKSYVNEVWISPRILGSSLQTRYGYENVIEDVSGSITPSDLIGCVLVTYAQYSLRNYRFPEEHPLPSEMAVITNAVMDSGEVKLTFSNYVEHLDPLILDLTSNYAPYNYHSIAYRRFVTTAQTALAGYVPVPAYDSSLNEIPSSLFLDFNGDYFICIDDPLKFLQTGDYLMIDYGRLSNMKFDNTGSIPYRLFESPLEGVTIKMETTTWTQIQEIRESPFSSVRTLKIPVPPCGFLVGSTVLPMRSPFDFKTKQSDSFQIERNMLSTQPFTIFNKWYTKIYYQGSSYQDGTHIDPVGQTKTWLPDGFSQKGGNDRFSKYESKDLYLRGMKGLKLPFVDLSTLLTKPINSSMVTEVHLLETARLFIDPIASGYVTTQPHVLEDYSPYLVTDTRNQKIGGAFLSPLENLSSILSTVSLNKWISYDTMTKSSKEYPYIVVEGIHLGYGGKLEERFPKQVTDMIVNNDVGFKVSRVQNTSNKQVLYLKMPSTFSTMFTEDKVITQPTIYSDLFTPDYRQNKKNRNRNDGLPIDIQIQMMVDQIASTDQMIGQFEQFGTAGRVVKKKIQTPYNLNPNNYVFIAIPNLNHIEPTQNNLIEQAFTKILLPGNSNMVLYNTFVGGSRVFYDNLFNNLNELEIAFLTNDGNLFDFNGSDNSFAIEITELIDKFEYINPRFGNIEL